MPALRDTFMLPNGQSIPKLGLGTWQIPDGRPAYDAVTMALAAGYRHIDTARAYGNEASVGRAIRDSGLRREDIFVTTKLPAEIKTPAGAEDSFARTLAALGLEHVDLYLIHAPWPWSQMGTDHTAGNQAVWKCLERFHAEGRARAIGVSNFSERDLNAILDIARVPPHANQIKFFVGSTPMALIGFCREKNILVEGYSPLGTGTLVANATIAAMAQRYGRSAAQLCIRYSLQHGLVTLPKSTHRDRIAANADVDFEISGPDMAVLDGLTNTRARRA